MSLWRSIVLKIPVSALSPFFEALFLFPFSLPMDELCLFSSTTSPSYWISELLSTYPAMSLRSRPETAEPPSQLGTVCGPARNIGNSCASERRYSWCLHNMGWNYAGPLTHGFLSVNTVAPSNPWVLHPQIWATGDGKTVFLYSQPQIPNCWFPTLDGKYFCNLGCQALAVVKFGRSQICRRIFHYMWSSIPNPFPCYYSRVNCICSPSPKIMFTI